MEKKTECEIVQDLLFSYADDVLNVESKKLVEKHLTECQKCQEKLIEIQNEKHQQEQNQKTQIDYLKKIRRKNKIKSFLWAVLILGILFASWYLYKFSIIHKITKKVEEQFVGENFYIEEISNCEDDSLFYNKTWYKDGKFKVVSYCQKEEEIMQMPTRYGNMRENPRELYFVYENLKEVRKEIFIDEGKKEDVISANSTFLSNARKEEFGKYYMLMKLGEPFYVKISTDHKNIGRLYYVFDFGESKKWVDMTTGLPIMSFGTVSSTEYYGTTKIPKSHFESISEYRYEFETVTDEDVQMPSFEGYEFSEHDQQEELNKLLEQYPNPNE